MTAGLGWEHSKARKALLARLVDGSPCPFCGRPMFRTQRLQADHYPPRRYGLPSTLRLAHGRCNEAEGGRAGAQRRWSAKAAAEARSRWTSRRW